MQYAKIIDELKEQMNEISKKYIIESDSNIIGKHLDINHIDFCPTSYCKKLIVNW